MGIEGKPPPDAVTFQSRVVRVLRRCCGPVQKAALCIAEYPLDVFATLTSVVAQYKRPHRKISTGYINRKTPLGGPKIENLLGCIVRRSDNARAGPRGPTPR